MIMSILFDTIVSIHAPREGCDESNPIELAPLLGFNSRTPGGVRLPYDVEFFKFIIVSIHAPREGCDVKQRLDGDVYSWFQFTHPGRGATISVITQCLPEWGFNSRTPGGVRQSAWHTKL